MNFADLVAFIQANKPDRIDLTPRAIAAIQDEMFSGPSTAVYSNSDTPPRAVPPGAVMVVLGTPIYSIEQAA